MFTGLFHRKEIQEHFRAAGVPDLYPEVARRKILPRDVERRVLAALAGKPLFRKTSCGVAFAHSNADYNGHYGIREICNICPSAQLARCACAHRRPEIQTVHSLARAAGLDVRSISVDDRKIQVSGSSEQQRYFVQHSLNFQVHDRSQPHLPERHGRAEVGWE